MPTQPHAWPDASEPLLSLTALEQAALVREGSVTSQALVDLYLARIRRLDPQVGAFVSVLEPAARRDAELADRARRANRKLGAFHGVPTAMKDLHLVRGTFTRMGSRAWRYFLSPVDDATTRSVRRAGFVITGKTTTSELGLMPIVETDIHPPTRNPWNLAHTAGGSSGGAGAAVAAGLLPIAPGSDGAGSVRIPSTLCGLVGMKPSRGLVPHSFKGVDVFEMASVGPMARTVDDAAALLDVLCEREVGEAGSHLVAAREPVRRLRIGLLLEPPMGETHVTIAARVQDVAASLRSLGHTVVEVAPARAALDEFLPIYQDFQSRVPALLEWKLQPVTRWFRAEGRGPARAVSRARFDELSRRVLGQLDGVDVLVSPTVPVLPPKVGEFAQLPPREQFCAAAPLGAFTAAWNLSGLPAITLPCGRVEGFPIGVQLVGRLGTDGGLLALARELEPGLKAD